MEREAAALVLDHGERGCAVEEAGGDGDDAAGEVVPSHCSSAAALAL